MHQPNPNFVAKYLPKVLSEESVARQRREELELVFRRSKKIRKVLGDVTGQRKALTSLLQEMQKITTKAEVQAAKEEKKKQQSNIKREAAAMLGMSWGKPTNVKEMIHFFDETNLGL